ncbi:MAG: AsmA-like C-terminal domain-containing protein [Nitrospirae bacterium]|nr:AsmA-like C-terminal domain-containing protein [Nitrospirota bacterium]MDA1304804.1 AsmA-like C-terminal domain-containing protein [Nitrospirota bacterium]
MSDKVSGRRRTLLMFFLLVMFGTLALGYLMTFHLDTIRRIVQQQMVDAFGPNLTIGDIQVAFFPSPRLTLTDLKILEPEVERPLFQASKIQLDLSFLSVLQDEVVPKWLKIENPEVYLRRNEQGKWNAEAVWQGQPSGANGVGAMLRNYSLTIHNGFIQVVDGFPSAESETLEFSQVELAISNLSDSDPMDVLLSAHLDKEGSQLSVEGTLSDVNQLFLPIVDGETPSGPNVDLRTQVTLEHSALLPLAKIFHIEEKSLLPHGRVTAQSQLRYSPGTQGFDLVLSDVILLTDAIDVQGQVSVAGFMTSAPQTISATWASAPMSIKRILDLVPAHMIPDEVRTAFVKQSLKGDIQVVSATVTGSNREDVGFGVTGEFRLSNASVDLGTTWGVAEKIEGRIFIKPDQVEFTEVAALYDSIPVSSSKGKIEFREKGPWLSTDIHGDVPSKKFIDILRSLFGWTNPSHAMAGFVGESGSGNMVIHLAGPLRQPERITLEHARYEPEQATIHFPGIKGPITNVTGTVNFSQTHVSFEPLNGILGANPVALQGAITFQDSLTFDSLKIAGRVTVQELANQLNEYSVPIQEAMSGSAYLTTTLSGPLGAPHIRTLWNLEALELDLGVALRKKQGVKGTFEAEIEFQQKDRLNIQRMILALPSLTLTGQATVDRRKNGAFTVSVNASPFTLSSLPQGVTVLDGSLKNGAIEVAMTVDGQGDDWRLWNKNGSFALSKGSLIIDGLTSPMSNVTLHMNFDQHVAEIKQFQFEMEQSQAMISGLIKDWETQPKVKFKMIAPKFDLDLLIPKGERSPIRDALESIADTHTVGGIMTFEHAWYKNLNFENVHGRLQVKNHVVGIDQITAKVEQGTLEGRVLINLPVKEPATVKTWINMQDVSLAPLQQTFFSKEMLDDHLVTGTLSVQGMLEGHGKGNVGVYRTLNGELKVLMKDGRIRRGTIIPKMLTLMNLPALLQGKIDLNKEGYPFDTQAATVTIQNGVMTSKDIFMDGPILKLTGAGTYDLVDDQLDLAIAASPFGPYFKLLRKVPLFGLLLEGNQDTIGMALFDVKGPIHDPVIKPLPLESFKTGLTGFAKMSFNVLKNAITLPKNILFPENTPEPATE